MGRNKKDAVIQELEKSAEKVLALTKGLSELIATTQAALVGLKYKAVVWVETGRSSNQKLPRVRLSFERNGKSWSLFVQNLSKKSGEVLDIASASVMDRIAAALLIDALKAALLQKFADLGQELGDLLADTPGS